MTATGYNTLRAISSQKNRFRLELLENRTLLNSDIYGIADVFYSDAAFDSIEELEAAHAEEHDASHDVSTVSESGYIGSMDALKGEYTLYLNFDAARVYSRAGDFWLGTSYVDTPGYDLNMYGWDGYEQQSIEYITEFVQEDYAAYNVNVTATEPTSGSYTTIYVGGTSDWFKENSNIIGVASYDIGNRNPSNYGFAFTEELSIYKSYSGNSLLKFSEYVANLISHEAGHTFGANHVSDSSYMMNPTLSTSNRTIGFGNGRITGSESTQDTQSLLGTNLGYHNGISDDYGNNVYNATAINPATTGSISGILEHVSDTDAFSFVSATSGTFAANIATTAFGNLDSTLTVYGSDNSIIVSNDNYFGNKDALLDFEVVAGEKYTVVVGSSNQRTSGTYTLYMSAPEGTPKIQVTDSHTDSDDLSIDFGQIYIGESDSYSLKISNTGTKTLVINEIATTGNFDYSIPNNKSSNISIAAGGSTTIMVSYNPDAPQSENGQIIISSNDTEEPVVVVNVTGMGLTNDPDILISDANPDGSIDLGTTGVGIEGTGSIIIRNDGRDTLVVSSITASEGFGINVNSLSLAPGSSQQISIYFSSEQAEILNGELTIVSNDPDQGIISYDLTGQILSSEESISSDLFVFNEADGINDGVINAGSFLAGDEHVIDLWYVTNNSSASITLNLNQSISSVFTTDSTITIPAGQSFTVSTTFDTTMPYSYSNDITLAINNLEVSVPLTVNVDSYAEFGGRTKYTFSDHDGDSVTLILKNSTGRITLGNDGEADIKNLEISEINKSAALTIKTNRGGYTSLGNLNIEGDVNVINATTTDLTGTIDINGEITALKLNDINHDAMVDITASSKGSTIQFNENNGDINVDGMLKTVKAGGNIGGNIYVNGDLRTIVTRGDITSDIAVDGNINSIRADKIVNSNIDADGYIRSIGSSYIEGSAIHAKADIYSVAVRNNMTDSVVSAGYSPIFGQNNSQVNIRNITVRNQLTDSTISSGITPDELSGYINGDTTVHGGTISNVRIGNLSTLNGNDAFGVIANGDIKMVKIGREKITGNSSENDFNVIEIL